MKNKQLRDRDLVAMHQRPGAGRHGGGRRATCRRDREAAKRALRVVRGQPPATDS